MSKKVVAIISVLKPVDDVRNFEKIGSSLDNTSKYEINIIGFSAKKRSTPGNIKLAPIFSMERLNVNRWFAGLKTFRELLKVKPELIIVTCSELLVISVVHRILFGTKIIYDIQENYFRNILYTNSFWILFRFPIAIIVRWMEWLTSPFIYHFFLAEKIYATQLGFIGHRYTILENKPRVKQRHQKSKKSSSGSIRMLYCGTIAKHYGIFEAISFLEKLCERIPNVQLTIMGFAADKRVRHSVWNRIYGKSHITAIGIDELVPHDEIIEEMCLSDFCLLPYHQHKSTAGRIPTKLYECLALEIPVIAAPNPTTDLLVKKNNAGIIHDFNEPLGRLDVLQPDLYYGNQLSDQYVWHKEEELLVNVIGRALGSENTNTDTSKPSVFAS